MGVLFNVQVLITSSWVRLLQSDKLCWGLGTFTWKLGDGKFIYLWWLLNNKKPIKYSANTILLWIVISFQLRSYLIPELNVVLPMIWFSKSNQMNSVSIQHLLRHILLPIFKPAHLWLMIRTILDFVIAKTKYTTLLYHEVVRVR